MEMNLINNVRLYDAFYKTDRTQTTEKKGIEKKDKDSVALSDTAKFYKAASSALAKTPDIREDKVEHLKSLIDRGKYNISSEQLADKILKLS